MHYTLSMVIQGGIKSSSPWINELESGFPTSINLPFTSLHPPDARGRRFAHPFFNGHTTSSLPCSQNGHKTGSLSLSWRHNGVEVALDLI